MITHSNVGCSSDTPETPVISGTLAATEGQLVTLNCSVCYHCPSRPPALRWTWERGVQPNITESGDVQTLDPEAHRPVVLASLSFTVSHQVKPRLRCEASYPGAKVVATSKELHVTCEQRIQEHVCVSLLNSHSLHTFVYCVLSSLSKRRSGSGPVADVAGGGQCPARVLM